MNKILKQKLKIIFFSFFRFVFFQPCPIDYVTSACVINFRPGFLYKERNEMQRYNLSPRGKLYLKTDAEGKPDDYIKSLKNFVVVVNVLQSF